MPTFIAQGRFTGEAVRGMVQTPEDRTEPVARLFESLGAKLIGWYMTSGDYDWLLIVEAPNQDLVVSAAVAATSGGSARDIKTFAAWSGRDSMAMFEKARGAATRFKSAGQAAPSS